MNILELKNELEKLGVPNNLYSLLKGGLPNEKFCIVEENDKWIVYYSERGRKSNLKTFSNELEACEYFFNKLKKYAN